MAEESEREYSFSLFVAIAISGIIFSGFLFGLGFKLASLVFGGF